VCYIKKIIDDVLTDDNDNVLANDNDDNDDNDNDSCYYIDALIRYCHYTTNKLLI